MKKLLFILFSVFLSGASFAQTVQDIFGKNSVTFTFLGIDYTHVALIGDVSHPSANYPITPDELKFKYLPAWNQLFIKEQDKYNVAKMLHRRYVLYNLEMIRQLNAAVPLEQLKPAQMSSFYTKEQIQSFVNSYPIENQHGIGVVFLAESMSTMAREAHYHIVFLNMETKEVLLSERMVGAPDGIGFRNYWACSYYRVMQQVKERQYTIWKQQYAPATVQKPLW